MKIKQEKLLAVTLFAAILGVCAWAYWPPREYEAGGFATVKTTDNYIDFSGEGVKTVHPAVIVTWDQGQPFADGKMVVKQWRVVFPKDYPTSPFREENCQVEFVYVVGDTHGRNDLPIAKATWWRSIPRTN